MEWPKLSVGEIHLWRAALDTEPARSQRLIETLSEDEKARAARFHFPRDRDRFARCRGLLRAMLGRYLSADPRHLRIVSGENGKPSLGEAHAGSPLSFNLSHSEGMALLGFCLGRPIGVDVERLRPVPDAANMVESYFSSSEKAFFKTLSSERRDEEFLVLWTKKEAYMKGIGKGLSHPLDEDPDPEGGWVVERVFPGPGAVAAVAVPGPMGKISMFQWNDAGAE